MKTIDSAQRMVKDPAESWPLRHGMDGDGLCYPAAATLVQSRGLVWQMTGFIQWSLQ